MQSIIILAPVNSREKEILRLTEMYHVSFVNKEVYSFKEDSGIDEVRQIIHSLRLAHSGPGYRMVLLGDLDYASIPAQNALLKLLEEPPNNTILAATCENLSMVIDTIVSRCVVIKKIPPARTPVDVKETKILDDILESSKSQRLVFASKEATSREQAISLLTALTDVLYTRLHDSNRTDHKITADLLNRTQKARSFIEANVTPRAVVDVLLLGFPRSLS